jgi:hypothetical protein
LDSADGRLTALVGDFPQNDTRFPSDLDYGFVQTKESKKMEPSGWIFEKRVMLRNNW